MFKITAKVEGMACGMCEAHINDAVRKNFAVKKVTSSHSKGKTEIIVELPIDEDKLKEVIGKSGYTVTVIHTEPYEKKDFRCSESKKNNMKSEKYKHLTLDEFNRAAEKFDDDDISVYNMCRKEYPDILEEVQKEDFQDLLDAGCGTGAMLGMFCHDLPDKKYTGVDLSPQMIDVANRKRLDGVQFTVGDCEALPFSDNSFDVITCSMSFHHYPNPDKFFQNASRVLRKNGRLVLRDMASSKKIIMWFINHLEIPILARLMHKGDVHVYSREEIQALCDQSGLNLERYEIRKGFRLHCVCRKS